VSRPSLLTYLFGNMLSVGALGLATIFLVYQAWTGGTSWFVPIVAIVVTAYAGGCNGRIEKYRLWKREWDAMGGETPAGLKLPRIPGLKYVVGFVLWAIFAAGIPGLAKQPGMGIPVALFWLGSFLMFGTAIYRAVKSRRPQARTSAKHDAMVSVSLPVPRQSPELRTAHAALPEYCRPLFQQR
jgi:hypothetical protein